MHVHRDSETGLEWNGMEWIGLEYAQALYPVARELSPLSIPDTLFRKKWAWRRTSGMKKHQARACPTYRVALEEDVRRTSPCPERRIVGHPCVPQAGRQVRVRPSVEFIGRHARQVVRDQVVAHPIALVDNRVQRPRARVAVGLPWKPFGGYILIWGFLIKKKVQNGRSLAPN
jgi:hypothetical protein